MGDRRKLSYPTLSTNVLQNPRTDYTVLTKHKAPRLIFEIYTRNFQICYFKLRALKLLDFHDLLQV